jgi:transposase
MAYFKNLIEVIKHLISEIGELQSKNTTLQSESEALKARNMELERMLKANSKNSHKPPSTDYSKTKKGALKPKGGKGQGGQPGHTGKTLKIVSNPDKETNLRPSTCTCGVSLDGIEGTVVEFRQVFDLPDPKLEVTQFNKIACLCPHCGVLNTGTFPAGVAAHVQYGTGVRALGVLLNNAYHMPYNKIGQLMTDLYGYQINESTLVSANEICYDNLKPAETSIKEAVKEARVAHFDETGIQAEGKRQWLHTACTPTLTHLYVSGHRGAKAMEGPDGIISCFEGWAVHDCYSTYFTYENCNHALCGAHLLRELQAQIETGSKWAALLMQFLLDLYQKSEYGKGAITEFDPYSRLYDDICRQADAEEAKPPPKTDKKRGKTKQSKGRNLLDRLVKHKSAVLAFAQHAEVPFTNNQAERDIRPTKTKQKVSNCFRTEQGAKTYARLQGFISTVRKQGQNVFDMLKQSFSPDFEYKFCLA